MRKTIGLLSSLIALLCLLYPPSVAAQNFSAALSSVYDVQENGTTQVTHHFMLTNTVSTEYITTYAFELAGNRNTGITVTTNGKKLDAKVTPGRNKTNISFEFPDKIVGAGQKREFEVTYSSVDIATKIGKTVEVAIPRLSDSSLFSRYSVDIKAPSVFGNPVSVQPKVFTTSTTEGKIQLHFEQLGDDTGIAASFGKQQLARLTLSYHLHNTNSAKGAMEIALPPDSMYQRVYYESIDPTPVGIRKDTDGNWLARFDLDANQDLTVTTKLTVATQAFAQDNASLLTRKPDGRYTAAQEYWQTSDPAITRIAKDLHTPQDIYAYVIRTLHYDYSKPLQEAKRLGAVAALSSPNSSLCTEFTDLFITLARKKGIPARAVVGYAYSQNTDLRPLGFSTDLLHTWPEYFDETLGTWIPVDPTWGQTTGGMDYFHHIDFNRIVFVTQGLSSSTPLPAGMYKLAGQETKDIETQFVESLPPAPDAYTSELHIKPRTALGLTDTYTVSLKNTSLHAVYSVPLTISAQNQDGTNTIENRITLIPLEEREIPVQLPRKGFFSRGTSIISVRVGGQVFTHELTLKTTIKQYLPFLVLAVLVVTCIGICIAITRRLLVPRWQR